MPLTEAEIAERLREVDRHLREVPPHHGGGLHDGLQRQKAELQRQLAELRRARAAADEDS